MMLLGGLVGAFACLLLLVLINRRNGFQPERILLSGIAITALFEPLQAIALANGDLRVQQLLSWMSGSTYYVTQPVALALVVLALLMLAACLLVSRWLDLMPMGPAVATALGIHLGRAQLTILLLVAVLTASATMVIGPLSFAGLLAPHLARLMGLVRARWHLLGAAGCGALLMVSADWIGQQILFPQEVSWARPRWIPRAVATAGPMGMRSSQRLTSRQAASISSANTTRARATGWVT
jgi:iron complex transport system permease protein